MTGIVVTGGKSPEFELVREYLLDADCIIAADSGLETLAAYGLEPDLVIGDMDSIGNEALLQRLPENKIKRFDRDKDCTDTELALNYLENLGYSHRIIIGGGGGRLDHLIAIYSLFSKDNSPKLWITDNEIVQLVEKKVSAEVELNQLISFFPVGNNTCRMKSFGLKWELNELEWIPGDSGISNVALQETIIVDMISGKLVMIRPLETMRNYGQ